MVSFHACVLGLLSCLSSRTEFEILGVTQTAVNILFR